MKMGKMTIFNRREFLRTSSIALAGVIFPLKLLSIEPKAEALQKPKKTQTKPPVTSTEVVPVKTPSCGPNMPLCPLTPPMEAYPNPFGEELTIRFWLENPAKVGIRLFDLTGRLVRQMEPIYMEAGKPKVVFPIKDLAAGVYRVQLEIDGKAGKSALLIHEH